MLLTSLFQFFVCKGSIMYGIRASCTLNLLSHDFFSFNTLKHFWLILGQRKACLVIFLWKRRKSLVVFLATILFVMAYIRPLVTILAKKTIELVLLFHKNIDKLVFIWLNRGQKCFKVLYKFFLISLLQKLKEKKWKNRPLSKKFAPIT